MTPDQIINGKPKSAHIVCVDCNEPATVVDRPMPLCARCANIVLCPDKQTAICGVCNMAYDLNEWDFCPNDDCILNHAEQDEYERELPDPSDFIDPDDRDYYDAEAEDE